MALGIVVLQGPRGAPILMSKEPLYQAPGLTLLGITEHSRAPAILHDAFQIPPIVGARHPRWTYMIRSHASRITRGRRYLTHRIH